MVMSYFIILFYRYRSLYQSLFLSFHLCLLIYFHIFLSLSYLSTLLLHIAFTYRIYLYNTLEKNNSSSSLYYQEICAYPINTSALKVSPFSRLTFLSFHLKPEGLEKEVTFNSMLCPSGKNQP